jgi:hypothetical protein
MIGTKALVTNSLHGVKRKIGDAPEGGDTHGVDDDVESAGVGKCCLDDLGARLWRAQVCCMTGPGYRQLLESVGVARNEGEGPARRWSSAASALPIPPVAPVSRTDAPCSGARWGMRRWSWVCAYAAAAPCASDSIEPVSAARRAACRRR